MIANLGLPGRDYIRAKGSHRVLKIWNMIKVCKNKDLHTYHLLMIIDHMDAPKNFQFPGISHCLAGWADLILDLVASSSVPTVFHFEFLGDTNTCGNRNAQESHVCQDDTDLSTGSGLEWL